MEILQSSTAGRPRSQRFLAGAEFAHWRFDGSLGPGNGSPRTKARLRYEEQVAVSITYDGDPLPAAFRADFIVEGAVIVEIKSIENILPIHHRQVLTYMRLSGIRKGLLLNFNVSMLKEGVKSFAM